MISARLNSNHYSFLFPLHSRFSIAVAVVVVFAATAIAVVAVRGAGVPVCCRFFELLNKTFRVALLFIIRICLSILFAVVVRVKSFALFTPSSFFFSPASIQFLFLYFSVIVKKESSYGNSAFVFYSLYHFFKKIGNICFKTSFSILLLRNLIIVVAF